MTQYWIGVASRDHVRTDGGRPLPIVPWQGDTIAPSQTG